VPYFVECEIALVNFGLAAAGTMIPRIWVAVATVVIWGQCLESGQSAIVTETTTTRGSASVKSDLLSKAKRTRTGRRYNPHGEENEEFCYTRPECGPGSREWGGLCQMGQNQSPIDIDTHQIAAHHGKGPVYVNSHYRQSQDFVIMNSGHTVAVMFNSDLTSRATISIDGFEKLMGGSTYIFSQLHFHWGSSGGQGSEHTINGRRYAMEAHFVHYNSRYENFTEAMEKPDGIAVFAVFFEESKYDNPALEPIVQRLPKVRKGRKLQKGYGLDLTALLPVMSEVPKNAFLYRGSLTTPECQESVTWVVFENIMGVSTGQLEEFRSLIDSNGDRMEDNFRPTQPLNGRPVHRISVYCGENCIDTGVALPHPGVDRIGRFHFPFIIIGPKIKTSISLVEAILAFINISVYFATILWILSLFNKPSHTEQQEYQEPQYYDHSYTRR